MPGERNISDEYFFTQKINISDELALGNYLSVTKNHTFYASGVHFEEDSSPEQQRISTIPSRG